jgi:hypothetical protein
VRQDTQHNDIWYNDTQYIRLTCDTQRKSIKTLSITMLCLYAERHYAVCHVLFIVMLNVVMPSVGAPGKEGVPL